MTQTKASFGREVLGPIFAEYALRQWVYLSSLAEPADTALLFCARGGLRMKLVYDRFLAASGLDSPVHAAPLMVSRVVAVRPALLAKADSAYEQIGYEFSKGRLLEAVVAISGVSRRDGDVPPSWLEPYTRQGFKDLLASDEALQARQQIEAQVALFRRHCAERSQGRTRIVLCDTGLFGSTLQLLMDGMPGFSWSAVMIARTNYKGLPTPHFPRTIGLSVEADRYCPWRARTSVLRYWHLVESVLEPNLPSVTRFVEQDGSPRSNLEIDGWERRIEPEVDSLFGGALDYIDKLSPGCAPQIIQDAAHAWRRLHRAIVWPRPEDGRILDVGRRSEDFGREKASFTARQWQGPIAALRERSMWREGEIALSARLLRTPLLAAIETAYGLRWLQRRFLRA